MLIRFRIPIDNISANLRAERDGLEVSQKVKPPRLKESPINMECRLLQMVPVGSEPLGGTVVIGEIVLFHVADELFDNFRVDLKKLAPIGRLAGSSYCRVTDIFDLIRPKTGEIKSNG